MCSSLTKINFFKSETCASLTGNLLPESSMHRLLKTKKLLKLALPAAVLLEGNSVLAQGSTDKFVYNKFYNSFLDVSRNVDKTKLVKRLRKVATLTASAIYYQIQKKKPSKPQVHKADEQIVAQLVDCFIFDSNCSLFRDVVPDARNERNIREKKQDFTYFVGIHGHTNAYRFLATLILAHFIGEDVTRSSISSKNKDKYISRANCTGETLFWSLKKETCVRAYVGTTDALSPAAMDDDSYRKKYHRERNRDPAAAEVWAESVWEKVEVRIFLVPSIAREVKKIYTHYSTRLFGRSEVRVQNLICIMLFFNCP